jgi:hypothetical protein
MRSVPDGEPAHAPSPDSRYDAVTRRLARAAALALALGLLAPSLAWSADGSPEWTWFWEQPRAREGEIVVAIHSLPHVVVLLVLAALGWVAAGWKPLVRRGRWLTCCTALALAVLANQFGFPSQPGLLSWPLGWQFLHLFLATAGLALAATLEHRRLGRLLCVLGGLYLLGLFLIPKRDWEWPILQVFLEPSRLLMLPRGIADREPLVLAFQVSIGLWALSALLLFLLGVAPKWKPARWRVAAWAVVAAVTSGWVRDFMLGLALHEGPYAYATVALNVLSWQAISCGQVLLLGTGLFAWIVGAREEQRFTAVFD